MNAYIFTDNAQASVGLVIIAIGLSARQWSGSCRSQLTNWWLDLDVNL